MTDFNNNFTNIDTLLDAVTKMQESEGIETTFKEIGTKAETDDSIKETNKQSCSHNCKTCGSNCNTEQEPKEKKTGFLKPFSTFVDDDTDDAEPYICEYCETPGYNRRYKPEICDTCTQCEACTEYVNGECSGCEYSVIRDGMYYRDKLPESAFIEEDELSVLNNLKYGQVGGERFTRGSFSVLKLG